ncbi:hypothetical protein HYALB_00011280 [Hymenoscyphus albidus]|uniref:GET complex subunit GET2 n=1 Tax=Hymenoscyphus albidus TaxID=595503 RepID=A0A9N9LRF5_9HELO|nr:hypothetical protein HYALB_00011280 [Hymenoscyphus albidus]
MADAATTSTEPESKAAQQARLRKEKREAKIRAGGSARLNKITGLGGGVQRDPPPPPAQHADPEEVDISEHYYEPTRPSQRAKLPSQPDMGDEQLRQMMLGFDPAGAPGGLNPFAGFPGMGGPGMGAGGPPGDDPMMAMLQQIMGGMPGEGKGGMPSFPGMGPMPGMPGQAAAVEANPYAYLWRIVHAIFALGLGLYIAFTTTFIGSKMERERSRLGYHTAGDSLSPGTVQFFYIFATVEVVLQTARFMLEKGKVQPAGWMGTVLGFLPEPYRGYVHLVLRYSRIWTTLSGDAMVCVFVLGVCVWVRGGQVA